MNNVLQLKGKFEYRKNGSRVGPAQLPKNTVVTARQMEELRKQLENILDYWQGDRTIGGALISVHYRHVVAKSNRLKTLLGEGSKSPNDSIRGAKFVWGPEKDKSGKLRQKHVFTHFVNLDTIKESIKRLLEAEKIVERKYQGQITDKDIEDVNNGRYLESFPKTVFAKVIVDTHYVEKFDIDKQNVDGKNDAIVTIYQTGINTKELLSKFGIDMINAKMIDDTTLRLTPDEMRLLQEHAPYLIAMSVSDISRIEREDIEKLAEDSTGIISIPKPSNEPVIGVLDTQFDENVYFHEWVKYYNKLDSSITINDEDKKHGTAVSSIIVDGPSFNPNLKDGCGRFQVRHFGVATSGRFSSFTILKLIRRIVAENRDIKVWNLSLGSALEINPNFMSPEAAELDKIQSEYDVIFVVAGTNKGKGKKEKMLLGAPADSLNSLVVNSVDFRKKSASYTRVGPVLSFFHKPDVSYYGGDGSDKIIVCEPLGMGYVTGTSFAAPWITRKLAYLIYIMGLSREVAKALIIDSAAGWNRKDDRTHRIGYGVVPKRIEDILYSKDEEIRFIMAGTIEDYETYTYNIPVPQNMKGYPYFARATLVYFPKSDRNQGVDYTSTEMDIHFGRVRGGKTPINDIKNNQQSEEGIHTIYEEEARRMYRKWDNVKHLSETVNERARPRKVYESGMWGLSIKTKERLAPKAGRGLQFGVVVTLKEMDGINRIEEFIKLCMVRGWIVNRLDAENQNDIYVKAEENIDLE